MLMPGTRRSLALLALAALAACDATPPAPAGDSIAQRFAQVRPFFEHYCFSCHGGKKPKGDLDLTRDFNLDSIAENSRHWDQVRARIQDQEMPPEDAKGQPASDERAAAIAWLRDVGDREARRNAGDPGIVLAHRLSNAEYDYTIRDLTGVDLRPTREFPVDPANEAGFDNSGESLAMSEALLRKYLAAARLVADHLVLTPGDFRFAPYPVVTDTDRDKYCVERIVAFYKRHEVDLAPYLDAVRRVKEHLGLRMEDAAREAGLSVNYMNALWGLLEGGGDEEGPVAELRTMWRSSKSSAQLAAAVARLRDKYPATVEPLLVKGMSRGSQPLLLWRNDQLASQRRKGGNDPAASRFCEVFPDAFVVLERGPYYDKSSSPKGRFLSAGFHLMQGYYRDDAPLYDLVLGAKERLEIDALWNDLHFVTQDALRQYKDFIFFERAEPPRFMFDAGFDFARSEDKDATSEAKITQLKEAYLLKAGEKGAGPAALDAIGKYFTTMNASIRQVDAARRLAEPGHIAALQKFAAQAWRRPLTQAERDDLQRFYSRLRDPEQLSHEDAIRDSVAAILMSPNFCYRFTQSPGGPLSIPELAGRLSYFLWSSMPDAELLAADLHQPEVLRAQARRMLHDPKVRGFATEFAGNWLDFRRFEEHNAVDRDRFPTFTNELRQAMFEEPIRYVMDVAQRNRTILDLLYGQDTIVNRVLAKHYGMPEPAKDEWVTIEDARPYGRGGLLPMAVFQTKNAPGLRTSPVKRGYWVVRRLLGEVIPPPPPTVPTLPKDEAHLGDLTLPQVLARHRDDPACAGCHRRFDSVGLAFEGYGPVGERRALDLGGKPVQTKATFPDGKDRDGLAGLHAYLHERRQEDFETIFCRKLLSYALSRSLIPPDRITIDAMRARGGRFADLVDVVVTSPQFLHKRAAP
jgi:hypothetical protein